MDFIVKKHNKQEFYPIFIKWSDDHKFPAINSKILPENCFVCYNEDNDPIYCIWFYHTDSGLAHIAFPISNKKIAYNKRGGGLDFLMNYVVKYGKRKKYSALFTTSNTKEIILSMDRNGFVLGDLNVNQYFKIL